MFDYSTKTKVIVIASLVILLGLLIWLINYNNSRSRDLTMVTQTRALAAGLESYFDKHNVYPEFSKIPLTSVRAITENGINQVGDYVYFQAPAWVMDGTVVSTKDRYIIEFSLNNSWDLWGISSAGGGSCRLSNYLEMICQSK